MRYLPEAAPADFVSLTMPVREEPWKWPRDLHPFFRQNLPEGYLLGVIREEFGPLLDGTDLSLLAVIGGAGIGRVTVTPKGVEPGSSLRPLDIESLLSAETSVDSFASLVRTYARAAISGAVPKFLGPDRTDDVAALGKSTLRTSRFIIKGSDDKTPFLGFNEFYSLRVLDRPNVAPVARARMSSDGRLLIVDRFDLGPDGVPQAGLEDACSLLGLPPHEKYVPSMEEVLRATRAYVAYASLRTRLEYTRMVEQVCESAVEVGRELIQAAGNDARWRGIAGQMLHVWNEGMTSLRYTQGERARVTLTGDISPRVAAGVESNLSAAPTHPQAARRGPSRARRGARAAPG